MMMEDQEELDAVLVPDSALIEAEDIEEDSS
jgi:hypothetical protein